MMQAEQVDRVCDIQVSRLLQMHKQVIIQVNTSTVEVSPETFNALIVH